MWALWASGFHHEPRGKIYSERVSTLSTGRGSDCSQYPCLMLSVAWAHHHPRFPSLLQNGESFVIANFRVQSMYMLNKPRFKLQITFIFHTTRYKPFFFLFRSSPSQAKRYRTRHGRIVHGKLTAKTIAIFVPGTISSASIAK